MQQNYTFYLCRGHAIAFPEAPKLKIKLTCVSVLFQPLCLYFFAGWNMPGHSQACEAWPLAREDCSFHWCAAQSALECTGELGTENASESTGSKAQVMKKLQTFSDFRHRPDIHNARCLLSHPLWRLTSSPSRNIKSFSACFVEC